MKSLERNFFEQMLRRLRGGRLTMVEDGHVRVYGEESPDGLEAMLEVHSPAFYAAAVFGGEIGMGESYMDGHWNTPDLPSLIRLAVRNLRLIDGSNSPLNWLSRGLARLAHKLRKNSIEGSRKNIRAHYDLSNSFFGLFLDRSLMYSAALWEQEDDTLEDAQFNKLERICRVLRLSPEDHILEIGSGWGTFALHAASRYGCRVTTTTISEQQFQLAEQRIAEAGLQDRITLLLQDYRLLTGQFSKIVSIEMFEAVGLEHYDTFFAACERLLRPGGSMLLQTITMNERSFPGYQSTTDWIQKYIFPGGELASVVEIQRSLARSTTLQLHDLSELGLHYAWTLREWRRRFQARLNSVREMGFDDRFIRMWDYYLGYCEGAFLERYIGDVQLLFVQANARLGVHGEPWRQLGTQNAAHKGLDHSL